MRMAVGLGCEEWCEFEMRKGCDGQLAPLLRDAEALPFTWDEIEMEQS